MFIITLRNTDATDTGIVEQPLGDLGKDSTLIFASKLIALLWNRQVLAMRIPIKNLNDDPEPPDSHDVFSYHSLSDSVP